MDLDSTTKIFPFVNRLEQQQYFIKVKDIGNATHWIPTFDNRFQRYDNTGNIIENSDTRVTLGKPYKLFQSKFDGNISIIDDCGHDITLYIGHHGYFVKFDRDKFWKDKLEECEKRKGEQNI